MKSLEGLKPTDGQFDELLGQLISDIRHHVQEEEEGDVLPRLADSVDPPELDTLADRFESAKKVAPTRPHPSAPDQPPTNLLLDPGAGLVDRLRDALTRRSN